MQEDRGTERRGNDPDQLQGVARLAPVVRRRRIELLRQPGEGIAITYAKAMQIIELERDDWNFFCPATGRLVFTDDGETNTPALRGSWCHEVPEEPMHLAEELKPLWQLHLDAQAAKDEGADVVTFLQSVEQPNWVAFEITTCGMACGPVWSTAWAVLDLSESEAGEGG